MRISDELRQALDNQVRLEFAASNTYLAMASWSEFTGYEGAAAYFYAQSDERWVLYSACLTPPMPVP